MMVTIRQLTANQTGDIVTDMVLKDYLAAHGLSYASFGEKIGVSGQAVWRYATQGRVPSAEVMRRIIAATDGEVQANDFFKAA